MGVVILLINFRSTDQFSFRGRVALLMARALLIDSGIAEPGEGHVLLYDQNSGADSYIAIRRIEAFKPLTVDYLDDSPER